jgi:hypothetical protein
MIKAKGLLSKAGRGGIIIGIAILVSGCASIIEGSTQKIRVHCQPSDELKITVDGQNKNLEKGELSLEKTRETHFVTFSREGFSPSTVAFDRQINPFWPVADLIWGPAFPLAWLLDWHTGSIYRIDPRDLHVVLRKQD